MSQKKTIYAHTQYADPKPYEGPYPEPYPEAAGPDTPPDSPALDRQEGGRHYKDFTIQPVEFCYRNDIPYMEATAIKYLCRHRNKGRAEDLHKAKHFIDLLLQMEYGQ